MFLRILASFLTILVSSQTDFDALPGRLSSAVSGDTRQVTITITPGRYFYRESHLAVQNVHRPDLSVIIQAEGAEFIGAASASDGYMDAFVSLDSSDPAYDLPEPRQVLARPQIMDLKTRLCRVRADEKSISQRKAGNLYLVLTQWYTSRVFKVVKIASGYIWFTADPLLSNGHPAFDPDSDYKYGRVLPRYMLLDTGKTDPRAHRTSSSRFLTVVGSELKSFSWTGGRFIGNGGKDCLMQFYRSVTDSVSVSRCQFEHIHGPVIQVQHSPHFRFRSNRISQCWRSGVIIDYFSPDAVVAGNAFEQTGKLMMQDFAVLARGSGFDIRNNLFCDFAYSAIGIGTHYTESIPASSSGFVRDNELFCSAGFNRGLMDSGAIYVYTVNKDVTICRNYIHDIGGYGDNRGIFCDDGTINVKILDNRILRIRNSYCIDLRRVSSIETDPRSSVRKANVGNRMDGNIVDGRVRFVNRDE